jgi:lipid-A-disaccharide synthase
MQDFLSISDFSLATSGTATLESAILGCPPIICYKTNPINYLIISRMLKIRNIGLPNILLDTDYFTELIQKDCNVTNNLEASEKIPDMRLNNAVIEDNLKNILTGDGFESVANKISQL